MEKGDLVMVYTDGIVGYEGAILLEKHWVTHENLLEKWTMETVTGTRLVRFVKNYGNPEKDGCGYLIKNIMEALELFDDVDDVNNYFRGKNMMFIGNYKEYEVFKFREIDVEELFVNGEYPPECCFIR